MTWKTRKLGEICDFQNGFAFKSSEYSDSGYFVMRIGNVQDGYISLSDPKYIKNSHKPFEKFILHSGDILVSLTGNVGRVGVINDAHLPAVINQRVARIVPKNMDIVQKQFLLYFFKSPYFIQELIASGHGAAQQNISTKDIENVEISLPSISEQQQIVKILDKVFEKNAKAKENTEKNLQNAKTLFESYLQSVFDSPSEDWEVKKLGDVCSLITKGSSPKWQGIKYIEEHGVLFITSENVGEGQLIMKNRKYVEEKFNKKDKKSILQKGDVLTNIVGASIGRTAIFNLNEVANINQAVCILRCKPEMIFNMYLMNILNSPFLKTILHASEVNTARANLSLGFFSNLAIPLPSLFEQKTIVTKLHALSAETKKLEVIYRKKLTDLEELKKSVLRKAFSGELK